jgi:hypothetical protein
VQEISKLKGLLVFLIKVIYKLSFEVVFPAKNAELQISFEVLFTNMYLLITFNYSSPLAIHAPRGAPRNNENLFSAF